MSRRAIGGFAAIALFAGIPATGHSEETPAVRKDSIPSWVDAVPVPFDDSNTSAEASDGVSWLLQEEQVKVDETADFQHFAKRLLTAAAVEGSSQIRINFDPAYQSLTLHKLIVYRDGKAIDRLPEQEVKLLQRESSMDRNLFDGRLSALMILTDIRPGDVIEYAFTLRGSNPIFGGRYLDYFTTRWDEPERAYRFRLLWPADRFLGVKAHAEKAPPVATRDLGGSKEYVWQGANVEPLISDGDLPSWFDPYGWVQFSEFRSWNEVAKWAVEMYPTDGPLPPDLDEELKKISRLENPEARALAALHFVQDNIRYLGIEIGANSHKPHPVEFVLQKRFGDCKDKALLLTTMLRRLGFTAWPALVDTDAILDGSEWLPTPLAFNHVVVKLDLDGRTYWLDATNQDQGGGLGRLFFPAYGKALVIKPETQDLTPIVPSGFAETGTRAVESYDFPNFNGEVTLRVHTVYAGQDADSMRATVRDDSKQEIRKRFLNYYADEFGHIKVVEPPKFHDDREKNLITCDEHYLITQFWKPVAGKDVLTGEFSAKLIRESIDRPRTTLRSMPMALDLPERMNQVIELKFPRELNFTREQVKVDDSAFKFLYSCEPEGTGVTLRYSYENLQDNIQPGDTESYLAKLDTVEENLGFKVRIPKSWVGSGGGEKQNAVKDFVAGIKALGPTGFWVAVGLVGFVIATAVVAAIVVSRSHDPATRTHEAFHRCHVCGKTEASDATIDFRVAKDGREYCLEHLAKPGA